MEYFMYYCFLCVVIFIFAYFNSLPKEGFTPSIRKWYRPYVRKARLMGTSLYNRHKLKTHNFFRKMQIL